MRLRMAAGRFGGLNISTLVTRRAVAACLAALLVVAACQQAVPLPAPTTGPGGEQMDPEGELRVPMGGEPDTIDPQRVSFVNEVAQTMLVYSALMTFDPDTLRPVPHMAAAMPDVSDDGLTYTFTIRADAKYSDGRAVEASDFVYGFQRLCDPDVAGDYAFTGYVVVGCEEYNTAYLRNEPAARLAELRAAVGVRAVDARTVEYRLREEAPYFPSIMGLWVGVPTREDMVARGGDRWTEPATFIGNGPFKLVEWRHNERMVFERNEHYVPKPKLKRIVKTQIADAAVAFAAYRGDEIDIYGVAGEDRRLVEGDSELSAQLVKAGGSCTFYYGFNVERPPFDDPRVRLAFARAFDREAFVRDIQRGLGSVNESFIPPGFPGHDAEDRTQSFDPAAARALLSESRYGANVPPVKFTYASSALAKTRAEWIVGQWRQHLGIDVALDPVDRTAYTRLLKERATTPQVYSLGWCADYPDEQNWLTTVFHSTTTISSTGWRSEEFDALTRQADAEPDAARRGELYLRAQRVLTAEAPAAFYASDASWLLVKPWVQGHKNSSMDFFFSIFNIHEVFVTTRSK